MVHYKKKAYSKGVSIIISNSDGPQRLDQLLSDFFSCNTHIPIQLLFVDQSDSNDYINTLYNHVAECFIMHIRANNFTSPYYLKNYVARKAAYPNLLFLNSNIIYNCDLLPVAVERLTDPFIGIVGTSLRCLLGGSSSCKGSGAKYCKANSRFEQHDDKKRVAHINTTELVACQKSGNGFYPCVTEDFLLCRKHDFLKLEGFCEKFKSQFADLDLCLRMNNVLGKKTYSCGSFELRGDNKLCNNITNIIDLEEKDIDINLFLSRYSYHKDHLNNRSQVAQTLHNSNLMKNINYKVLFVLPTPIDSNSDYHARSLARCLSKSGVEVDLVTPDKYNETLKNGIDLKNDVRHTVVHAWTPREVVRNFIYSLRNKADFIEIIHLENDEEYLTEVTVGKPINQLIKLTEKNLDAVIPPFRYHPIRGRKWLSEAHGLTMISKKLSIFKDDGKKELIIVPPPDYSLFYPRLFNYALRKKLAIPNNNLVIVYTGHVHKLNVNEVRSLYQAVIDLNSDGFLVTLIRTGNNHVDLGIKPKLLESVEKPLGWVGYEYIPNILAAADIFVQPEEPGLFNDYRIHSKVLEYMAIGRPIILPNSNDVLEMEHLKDAYILKEADAENIVSAVKAIAQDALLAERLAEGSRSFIVNKLDSPETVSTKLINFYSDIVSIHCHKPKEVR